jgi:hypothetical protein
MARKKARPKKLRPLDAEVFELADKVAMVFDRPDAVHARARLFHDATAYRNRYRPHGPEDLWATTTKWTAFLLRLILTCPRILSRPHDFEWVMTDLEWILIRRRISSRAERDFWDALKRVTKAMRRTGLPRDKALDYVRFERVQSLTHPPVQLEGLVAKLSKSEAIECVADLEEKLVGKRPHERVIYRSLERVEKELKEIKDLLGASPSFGPPPTEQRDSPRIKKTSMRTRRSPRQKRVRRKYHLGLPR